MLWCKDKLLIDFSQRHRHKADDRVANALELGKAILLNLYL